MVGTGFSAAVMLELKERDRIPTGVFHDDRAGHNLADLAPVTEHPNWQDLFSACAQLLGG